VGGGQLVHLALTSSAAGTRLYVEGVAPAELRIRESFRSEYWQLAPRLVLGNSAYADAGWPGEFRGLALFNRALDERDAREHAERLRQSGAPGLRGAAGLCALSVFDAGDGDRVDNWVVA
jgi:hypothetical protein